MPAAAVAKARDVYQTEAAKSLQQQFEAIQAVPGPTSRKTISPSRAGQSLSQLAEQGEAAAGIGQGPHTPVGG